VFIHGGYWYRFSSKEFSFVAGGPVSAGVTTILTDYALCPAVTLEEIVRQSRAAVAWVYANAEGLGDRERIFVSGHSAGGHLATMVALTDWEGNYGLPADTVKGAIPISGLYDLRPFPYTYLQPKLQLTWGEVWRNSPLLNLPGEAPPLVAAYGGEETPQLHRQSEDFLAAWKAKSLDGDLLRMLNKKHYSLLEGFLGPDNALCSAVLKWVGA
jgi:arylformamidase